MKYPKIPSIFKRDSRGHFTEEYSTPEIEFLKDVEWIWTEKVDGMNIRIIYTTEKVKFVRFRGRTDNAQIPPILIERLEEMFPVSAFESIEQDEITLYGEGYGVKIQKDGENYKPDGVDFVLFDVRVGDWWLKRLDVADVSDKLRVGRAPARGVGSIAAAVEKCKEGFNSAWGNFQAEGLVLRPKVELFARNGDRIITKVKHKDFNNSKGGD